MKRDYAHVNDENLLLYASGELEDSAGVDRHLAGCEVCRGRLERLQSGLAEFAEAYRQNITDAVPAAEARATLKARMAEVSTPSAGKHPTFGWAAVAAAGFLLAVWLWPGHMQRTTVAFDQRDRPDVFLTPGATVPVTQSEVCGSGETSVPAIPVSLQQKVFQRYGVTRPPDQYEVDYLITPELGGATDIRNLWPQPYRGAVWNAHVKDQLEHRLHSMVCRGEVDLATAQRDIATDWIAAYRKYFHAEAPISDAPGITLPESQISLPRT